MAPLLLVSQVWFELRKSKGQCQKYALSKSPFLNKETTIQKSNISIKGNISLEMKQEIISHSSASNSLKLNVNNSKYSISYLLSKSVLKIELNVDLNTLRLQKCQTRKHSSLVVKYAVYVLTLIPATFSL